MVGFFLGSASGAFDWLLMLHITIGTLMTAAGTSAHNQYIERDLDGKMKRTRTRPLPLQKIAPARALLFSSGMMLFGLAYLMVWVNPVAAAVSAVTSILYLAFYTPLKRISFANVFVGAIPGALPPVGGWAAASGNISDPGMWMLFGIVFFWQIPHVVSIGWLCDEDYTGAGFKMLPKGRFATPIIHTSIFGSLAGLVAVSTLLFFAGLNSWLYLTISLLLGAMFLYYAIRFVTGPERLSARKLMFASLIYLPAVWIAIIADRLIL